MIINLSIEKQNAKDCPYDCLFKNCNDGYNKTCTIFNEDLETNTKTGDVRACYQCEEMYIRQKQMENKNGTEINK